MRYKTPTPTKYTISKFLMYSCSAAIIQKWLIGAVCRAVLFVYTTNFIFMKNHRYIKKIEYYLIYYKWKQNTLKSRKHRHYWVLDKKIHVTKVTCICMVEMRRVELLSEDSSTRVSPSAGYGLHSLCHKSTTKLMVSVAFKSWYAPRQEHIHVHLWYSP